MVEITARAGLAILGDQDLCTYCICRGDRKGDVVPGSNIRCEKTGNQEPGLIGEHTATWAFLPLNAHYALRADGHGRSRSRNGGRGRHAFGRQYRVWDAFVIDRPCEEFCKKHGDQIYMELLDPPIAKWL